MTRGTNRSTGPGADRDASRGANRDANDAAALLVSTSARLTRLYGKVLGQLEVPLTFRQHRLLMRIGEGHTSLAALAGFGKLTLPTVSESVDVLVRRDLITRQAHPASRRSLVLGLTPRGEDANRAAQAALADLGRNLLRDVSDDQRRVLAEALRTIFDAATSYFTAEHDQAANTPSNTASNTTSGLDALRKQSN